MSDLITISEAAAILRISRTTFWRMRMELPTPVRVSKRRVFYRRADIEKWIAVH